LLAVTALLTVACGRENAGVGLQVRAEQGLTVDLHEVLLKVFGAAAECVGVLQTPTTAVAAKPCDSTQASDSDSTCYIRRLTLDVDATAAGADLEVPAGRRVFFAAGFDEESTLLARGCAVRRIADGEDVEVTVTLLGL
jgi:hypothetical protein